MVASCGLGCRAVSLNQPVSFSASLDLSQMKLPPKSITCGIISEYAAGTDIDMMARGVAVSARLANELKNRFGQTDIHFIALGELGENNLRDCDCVLSLSCDTPQKKVRKNKLLFTIAWPSIVVVYAAPIGIAALSTRGIVKEETEFNWTISLRSASDMTLTYAAESLPPVKARVAATGWGTPKNVVSQSYDNADTHVLAAALKFIESVDWSQIADSARISIPMSRSMASPVKRTAAILPFDARTGVSADEVALLADRFAVELNRTDAYQLVPRSKMKEILELQAYAATCSSVECAVEAGQQLGVEYMIYGSIGRIGSMFTMNVQIASVEKGAVVAGTTMDYSGRIEGLLTEGMARAVERLLQAVRKKAD